MSEQHFTCDNCGGVFPMGDDAEARAELTERFRDINPADCAMVCDDCYEGIINGMTVADPPQS